MPEIRVFISSVQSEFSSERQRLCEYIQQDALLGQFFTPFIFENMPAAEMTAQQAYLNEAANCDIYIVLLGKHYGFEDINGVSPTELEYETATLHYAHRLAYVLRTDEPRHPKEQSFIQRVEQDVVRRTFGDYEELRTAVYTSLIRYLEQKEIIRRLPFDASANNSASWEDIDPKKVQWFVDTAKERRQFKIPFSNGMESVFSGIHILTEDGRLTNSALLLFAFEPQKFFRTSEVKCAQFFGTQVEKPIKSFQVYQGTLFELVDQAVGFVLSRIDATVGKRDRGSASSSLTYEIPPAAVTEAIVNAIAHRDYTSNASVQIMLFRDRLEIWNPGHLPYGLTPTKLRQLHSSDPTNPVIAHPLFLAGLIEHLGTGTTDIIKDCVNAGLRAPEFIQDEDFRVIIWRKQADGNVVEKTENVVEEPENVVEEPENVVEKVKKVAEELSDKLTPRQKTILLILAEDPCISVRRIAAMVGKQTRTIQRDIETLQKIEYYNHRLLERVGGDKWGKWQLNIL